MLECFFFFGLAPAPFEMPDIAGLNLFVFLWGQGSRGFCARGLEMDKVSPGTWGQAGPNKSLTKGSLLFH